MISNYLDQIFGDNNVVWSFFKRSIGIMHNKTLIFYLKLDYKHYIEKSRDERVPLWKDPRTNETKPQAFRVNVLEKK